MSDLGPEPVDVGLQLGPDDAQLLLGPWRLVTADGQPAGPGRSWPWPSAFAGLGRRRFAALSWRRRLGRRRLRGVALAGAPSRASPSRASSSRCGVFAVASSRPSLGRGLRPASCRAFAAARLRRRLSSLSVFAAVLRGGPLRRGRAGRARHLRRDLGRRLRGRFPGGLRRRLGRRLGRVLAGAFAGTWPWPSPAAPVGRGFAGAAWRVFAAGPRDAPGWRCCARLAGAAFLAWAACPVLLAISVAPFEVLIGRRRGRVRAG